MATTTVSSSSELRTAIQSAASGDVIELNGSGQPFSVTTLAKIVSSPPSGILVKQSGYTVQSAATGGKRTLSNTRIYQQNIDGPFAPGTVFNLILNYSNGNNTAIFRATSGNYLVNNVEITGTHGGWAGNGNVYMSMTVSNGNTPITTNFNFQNSTVSLTGQNGFDAAAGTGSVAAFLQSWNNTGNVTLNNVTFDEAGFKSSFHFATMYPGGASGTRLGSYSITNNRFNRSANANFRDRGNRLESVTATVTSNTFNQGAYLDLYGDLAGLTLGGNTFNTILNGSGMRFTKTSSSGANLSNTPAIFGGNTFNGYGLAITYVDPTPASTIQLSGSGSVKAGTLATKNFSRFTAGGQGGNVITADSSPDWINGGSGNDTINSATGSDDYVIGGPGNDQITTGAFTPDTILYYDTAEGFDTITDFKPNTDKLAFRSGGGGSGAFAGTIVFETGATPSTTSATWLYNAGVLSYDADGSGSGLAVNIATFTGSPTLSANDLVVF